jgi:hypothetical protein
VRNTKHTIVGNQEKKEEKRDAECTILTKRGMISCDNYKQGNQQAERVQAFI